MIIIIYSLCPIFTKPPDWRKALSKGVKTHLFKLKTSKISQGGNLPPLLVINLMEEIFIILLDSYLRLDVKVQNPKALQMKIRQTSLRFEVFSLLDFELKY